MRLSEQQAQQVIDALRQWAAAERDGDEDELENARKARDELLGEVHGDSLYDGPRCRKCQEPVKARNGMVLEYLTCTPRGWLCDSCAAAQEHEWDRSREDRG